MTRVAKTNQLQLGEIDISEIKINPRSRDDIPQIPHASPRFCIKLV